MAPTGTCRKSTKSLLGKAIPVYSGNLLGQIVFFPLLVSLANEQGISSVGILRVAQIIAQIFGILGGGILGILGTGILGNFGPFFGPFGGQGPGPRHPRPPLPPKKTGTNCGAPLSKTTISCWDAP